MESLNAFLFLEGSGVDAETKSLEQHGDDGMNSIAMGLSADATTASTRGEKTAASGLRALLVVEDINNKEC
jgi:hypothetical protein